MARFLDWLLPAASSTASSGDRSTTKPASLLKSRVKRRQFLVTGADTTGFLAGDDPSRAGRDVLAECIGGIDVERGAAGVLNRVFGLKLVKLLMTPQLGPRSASWPGASARSVTQAPDQKCPANNDTSRKRSLLEFRNDIAEYRRNIPRS